MLQVVVFLTSQLAPTLGNEPQDQESSGTRFTVQGIMHISKLLSSVPRDMQPEPYFSALAPQLLTLLNGDDPDLRRTAAYVIGNGILSKRAYGAPGAIGHALFVEPIYRALTAEIYETSDVKEEHLVNRQKPTQHNVEVGLQDQVLVDESTVYLAIERLSALTLQHPNPGLVKRLVHPVLLPLWGLACFSLEQQLLAVHEKSMNLLQTFFSISGGMGPLQKLSDNLLWDGGSLWTYARGQGGGVALKRRDTSDSNQLNIVQLMDSLDQRAELFVRLLSSDPKSEEHTSDIFLSVSQDWLVPPSPSQKSSDQLTTALEGDERGGVVRRAVSAKLAEKLLYSFKDTLSRHPLSILALIRQIIDGELDRAKSRKLKEKGNRPGMVSLSSLANIVPKGEDGRTPGTPTDEDSSEELFSTVVSLLSTILASPEFSVSQDVKPVLENIKSALEQLLPYLPPSLSKPGTTASMLLEIQLYSPEQQLHSGSQQTPPEFSDLDAHRQALANLNSDLPPIQAEGLSLLSDLINKSSPILDIPSTLTLLLSIITEPVSDSASNEEFVYLNVIKLIGVLASRHPRTVVKTLVKRYADRNEEIGLDQRLKIGESLLRTVQDLGEALAGETAKILGEGMISVAGRRGRKPQAQKHRKEQREKEERQRQRENKSEQQRPSGLSNQEGLFSASATSNIPQEAAEFHDNEDSDTETPEQAVYSRSTLAAWIAGADADEEADDLRARTSAISILGTAVETNLTGLGPSIASSAVDLALSTIVLEPAPESAIIRRASLVLLLDILKALDTSRERRSVALNFGFSLSDDRSSSNGTATGKDSGISTIGNLPHILRTLKYVEGRETDGTALGHIRVLIDSFEAWAERSLLWGIGVRDEQHEAEQRLELGDRIAGLSVDPLHGKDTSGRPRIEEIE